MRAERIGRRQRNPEAQGQTQSYPDIDIHPLSVPSTQNHTYRQAKANRHILTLQSPCCVHVHTHTHTHTHTHESPLPRCELYNWAHHPHPWSNPGPGRSDRHGFISCLVTTCLCGHLLSDPPTDGKLWGPGRGQGRARPPSLWVQQRKQLLVSFINT